MAAGENRDGLENVARSLGVAPAVTRSYLTNKKLKEFLATKVEETLNARGVREGATIKYGNNAPKWTNQSFPVLSTSVRWSGDQPQIELNKGGQYFSAMIILNYATVV